MAMATTSRTMDKSIMVDEQEPLRMNEVSYGGGEYIRLEYPSERVLLWDIAQSLRLLLFQQSHPLIIMKSVIGEEDESSNSSK